MIKQGFSIFEQHRSMRHILFWICWVIGFTFLKSLGKPFEDYLGWFSYYLLTLPIFVAHTYLVAYVLIPYFFSRKYMLVFMALFLAFFYGFSVLELLLSNEFIFKWYPTDTILLDDYLSPGAVIISGLGNLYIMLVFLAARSVRQWYIASIRKQELQQAELKLQMESTVTKMQPLMLLYAIDQIDRMVEKSSAEVTRAIALTSELLSDVMIYNEEEEPLFTKEISLVKKLVSLVSLFREKKPDVEFFISGDPGQIQLPTMILFTLIDMIFRKFADEDQIPELNIEASGFSDMISVQVLNSNGVEKDKTSEECMETLEQLRLIYREKVAISVESHTYGCSVMISKS
jgi:two-component system LytT family sensor kinase